MDKSLKNNRYSKQGIPIIGVVGPTGSGKTSLVCTLGDLLHIPIYEELPTKNPFLSRYYDDLNSDRLPSDVVLQSQLTFLLASIKQSQRISKQRERGAVWDVPPRGHKMYAELARKQRIMSQHDFQLYKRLYSALIKTSFEPDILLVVTADLNILKKRIIERSEKQPERKQEKTVHKSYWKMQIDYWKKELKNDKTCRCIRIDSGKIDWTRPSGVKKVWKEISRFVV